MAQPVDEAFPHLAAWVTTHGWIEIGYDEDQRSFIRALDSGGMVWEGGMVYATLEMLYMPFLAGEERRSRNARSDWLEHEKAGCSRSNQSRRS